MRHTNCWRVLCCEVMYYSAGLEKKRGDVGGGKRRLRRRASIQSCQQCRGRATFTGVLKAIILISVPTPVLPSRTAKKWLKKSPQFAGFVPMYYLCFNRVLNASAICKVLPNSREPMLSAWCPQRVYRPSYSELQLQN